MGGRQGDRRERGVGMADASSLGHRTGGDGRRPAGHDGVAALGGRTDRLELHGHRVVDHPAPLSGRGDGSGTPPRGSAQFGSDGHIRNSQRFGPAAEVGRCAHHGVLPHFLQSHGRRHDWLDFPTRPDRGQQKAHRSPVPRRTSGAQEAIFTPYGGLAVRSPVCCTVIVAGKAGCCIETVSPRRLSALDFRTSIPSGCRNSRVLGKRRKFVSDLRACSSWRQEDPVPPTPYGHRIPADGTRRPVRTW